MGKGAKGCITLVVGKQEQKVQIALPRCDITPKLESGKNSVSLIIVSWGNQKITRNIFVRLFPQATEEQKLL